MHNRRVSLRDRPSAPSVFRLMAACGLAISLAACNGTSSDNSEGNVAAAGKSSANFDAALEDTPCEVMPAKIVADVFSIPTEEIKEAAGLSKSCNYEGKFEGKVLNVTSGIRVFETADKAASSFRSVTAGMSASEVSEAMAGVKARARESGALDTQSKQNAADGLVDGLAPGGLQFVDVENLADQARFGLNFGTLYLLHGNMRIDLTAYYGPEMSMPKTYTPGAILEANKAWQAETRPLRKQQSIELAKGVLAGL